MACQEGRDYRVNEVGRETVEITVFQGLLDPGVNPGHPDFLD